MRRRFKDGRIYVFCRLRLPRSGFFHPAGHTLTVRFCPSNGRGPGRTWQERRRKLAREAHRITRAANQFIARHEDPWGAAFKIAGSAVSVHNVGLFMSDWIKMSRTGEFLRGDGQSSLRRQWMAEPHRKPGPGHREDQV